jgi:hypothetical protein
MNATIANENRSQQTIDRISLHESRGYVRCNGSVNEYTQDVLRDAFERVQSEKGWKNPIETIIATVDLCVTAAAIAHFTGSEVYIKVAGDDTMIYAPGYYETCGA